jgi:hypothetical protein
MRNVRIDQILEKISTAAKESGRRGEEIEILAVSKNRSVEEIREVYHQFLIRGRKVNFGENYAQELIRKAQQLEASQYNFHMIGNLQRNKCRQIIPCIKLLESVDRVELVEELQRQAERLDVRLEVLVQVNVSNDPDKNGVDLKQLPALVETIYEMAPNLKLQGLMAITQLYDQAEQARGDFRNIVQLAKRLPCQNPIISVGMSSDFEVAIEEGATQVRIGSLIFGER